MATVKARAAGAVLAALLAATGAAPLAAAAASLAPVKVGLPGDSIGFTPWFIGKDSGIFAKNGIDLTFVYLAGNALPAALVSNGIQATSLLSEVINANFAGYKVIAAGLVSERAPYEILAKASIHSVKDLRGKTIVSSPPKGLPNVLVRYFLATNGLDPNTDAKLLYIGSEAARRTLIVSGGADAIIEDAAHGPELERQVKGLHVIVGVKDMPEQSTGSGLGVAEDLLAHHPALVKRILRALLEVETYMKTHGKETEALIAQELKLPQSDTGKAAAAVIDDFAPSLVPSPKLFADDARIQDVVWGEKVAPEKFAHAYDTRLAAEVEKEMRRVPAK